MAIVRARGTPKKGPYSIFRDPHSRPLFFRDHYRVETAWPISRGPLGVSPSRPLIIFSRAHYQGPRLILLFGRGHIWPLYGRKVE